MRNPGGYAVITSPDPSRVNFDGLRCEDVGAGITERDTFSCSHCGSVEHVPVKLGPNDVGFCRHCMTRICQRCCDLPCTPFQKQLEEMEKGIRKSFERQRALKSYGL